MSTTELPDITVRVAFTTDPLDASPTWVDLSSRLRSGQISQGRSSERGRVEAGTLQLVLDNSDRELDPTNTSSTYYPNVIPMRKINIRAVYNAVTYDLYTGFIESWDCSYPKRQDAIVTIQASDAFKLFQLFDITAYRTEVLADSPVGYWPLDETSGTNADNLGSATADGTYSGVTLGAAGPLIGGSTAATFDGVNDRVSVGQVSDFGISGDVTIEAWVYWDGIAEGRILYVGNNTDTVTTYRLEVDAFGILKLYATPPEGGDARAASGVSGISSGVWTHVAAVREGSTTRFYINGATDIVDAGSTTTASTNHFVYVGDSATSAAPWDGRLGRVAVYPSALSPERIAAHYAATADKFASAATGTVVSRLLSIIDWPTGDDTIDAGSSTLQAFVPEGSLLDLLHLCATDTEVGVLYIKGSGGVGFHQRHSIITAHNTSLGTFGDGDGELIYDDISLAYDDSDLWTRVRVEREGGLPQFAESTTAATKYGPRLLEFTGLLYSTDLEAFDAANYYLARYDEAFLRIESLAVVPRADPTNLWAQVLNRSFHLDRITVIRRPPGGGTLTRDCHIIGLDHDFSAPGNWRTTWRLIQADAEGGFWIMDDATYSVLGTTTRLAF